VNPQQQMLLKIMPVFFAFISLTLPARPGGVLPGVQPVPHRLSRR
jgi:hypothetical protein